MTKTRFLLATALIGGVALAGPAAAAEVITIGAAVSLTGKYTTNGEHTQRGYDLAVDMINKAGGVKVGDTTYELAVKYYDDESTAARGAELAERLILQDGVQFMLGPYSSGLTRAIAPVIEEHKIPMVEGNGASRSLFTNGWRYIFATLSTSEQYLASAIALAAEVAEVKLGKPANEVTVALAFENDAFSQDVRAGVIDDIHKFGMTIVIDDKLPPELNDMAPILSKVKELKPDILVISGHSKGAVTGIRQVGEMRVEVPILAMTHCDSAKVIEKDPAAAEYTLCATQWAPSMSYSDDLFGSAGDFAKLFEDTYGMAPPYQAAESAAAVMVFADAFARAGTLDREVVRDALAATDIKTFFGDVRFDETGKNIAKPMALYQVLGGELKVVAPSAFAEAAPVIPRPPMN